MGTAILTSILTGGGGLVSSNCRSFRTPAAFVRTLASSNVFGRQQHKRVVCCSNNPTFRGKLTASSDVSPSARASSFNGYYKDFLYSLLGSGFYCFLFLKKIQNLELDRLWILLLLLGMFIRCYFFMLIIISMCLQTL